MTRAGHTIARFAWADPPSGPGAVGVPAGVREALEADHPLREDGTRWVLRDIAPRRLARRWWDTPSGRLADCGLALLRTGAPEAQPGTGAAGSGWWLGTAAGRTLARLPLDAGDAPNEAGDGEGAAHAAGDAAGAPDPAPVDAHAPPSPLLRLLAPVIGDEVPAPLAPRAVAVAAGTVVAQPEGGGPAPIVARVGVERLDVAPPGAGPDSAAGSGATAAPDSPAAPDAASRCHLVIEAPEEVLEGWRGPLSENGLVSVGPLAPLPAAAAPPHFAADPAGRPAAEAPEPLDPLSAGAVVRRRLRQQLRAWRLARLDHLLGGPEAVHDARVAARRLRSALRTFRSVLPTVVEADIDALIEELREFGRRLGGARDAEVVVERLGAALGLDPGDLAAMAREDSAPPAGEARRSGEDPDHRDVGPEEAVARRAMRAALARADGEPGPDPERTARLDAALERLATGTAFPEPALRPAGEVLPGLVAAQWRTLRKRYERADAAKGPRRDALLHEVRKAAKGLRYAAETCQPLMGERAGALQRAAAEIQEILGDHQDAVVTLAVLGDLTARRGGGKAARHEAAVIQQLVRRERRAARHARGAVPGAWLTLADPELRRWLR